MKFYPVEQGSDEWRRMRLGIPTASSFHLIMTPRTRKLSASARKYAFRLVAETLLNRPTDDEIGNSYWMDRGRELEPEAVRLYEFEHGVKTLPGGFITTDDGLIGCSPDRLLVGPKAALEVKCPKPENHLAYLIDGPGDDYAVQVAGQQYVAELEYVDFISHHSELPPLRKRTYRDEAYIRDLAQCLRDFLDIKNDIEHRVRSRGLSEPELERLSA